MTGRRKRGKPYRGTSPFIEAYEKAKENQCRETNTASPQALEDRYLSELGQGGERDDMLQALCRIADELKRSNDLREAEHGSVG